MKHGFALQGTGLETHPTFSRCKVFVLGFAVWVCSHGSGFSKEFARAEAAALADEYVDAFCRRERLVAGNAFLHRETERLKEINRPDCAVRVLLDELSRVDPRTQKPLVYVLGQNTGPVVEGLDSTASELVGLVGEFKAEWRHVRTSLNYGRFELYQVRAGRHIAAQLGSLLSVDKRWFWLFGVIAVATLLGLVLHERRHEFRRFFNGGRPQAMGLSKLLAVALVILVVLTLITFMMGDRIYQSLLSAGSGEEMSPRQTIQRQNSAILGEINKLEQTRFELQKIHKSAISHWQQTVEMGLPKNSRMAQRWSQLRAELMGIAKLLAVLEQVSSALRSDLSELDALNAELEAQTEARAQYLRLRQWIRGGLGLALIGLATTGGFFFRRGVKRRLRVTSNTCPLCLGVEHLEVAPDYALREGGTREVDVLQCKNVISQEPYEECDFRFMAAYRRLRKLCFPTLGVPQAGKTHWLAMLYWELNLGHYPPSINFEKIKSQSAEDIEVLVEEILTSRIGTAATQRERIPNPLVFNFQDRDRFGRSNVLVNIFDYSGEVTSDMGVEDFRRRRALDGDGFFFFLDPTYPSEPQSKALADFREDLRLIKGVSAGRQIRTPVALCISKIDILAGRSHAIPDGGDAITRFYDELGEIDPTGESMTREVIEARSRATARLRDTIWPGWQIERHIHDLFGGRYLFFPLTPVGLDGLGETDLSLRTISPFGLLEPLMWLLEMNGYPVLE